MKIRTHLLYAGIILALGWNVSWAEKTAKEELDALSAEADAAPVTTPNENKGLVEPAVELKAGADVDALTKSVADKLGGLLAQPDEGNIDDKLEQVISSSLLEGNEMKDIRTAVNSALSSLADSDEVSAEKLSEVTASLQVLVGTANSGNAPAEDSYLSSLKAEAADINEPAFPQATVVVSPPPAPEKTAVAVAPAATAAKPATPQPALADTVTVQKGESLYKIALRIYGTGERFMDLYQANRDQIADPNLISVGQVLKVPR